MKYLDEYRDSDLVQRVIEKIERSVNKPWIIMEICGGQTHSIVKYGLDQLLPKDIELVHGPGCPVCVTPIEKIDKALSIASQPGVIFTSYGDMLRVPGSIGDLYSGRASGNDIRVVYSPLDAVKAAQDNPDKEVVFFAIGFETTAPANAMSVLHAQKLGLNNFSLLVSHFRVPPAMHAILGSPHNRVQGFLAAGHVCTIMGYWEYEDIAQKYNVPIVVTGFEPVDILHGILVTIIQLEEKRSEVRNAYSRVVSFEGNKQAQKIIKQVFEDSDQKWRGIGNIPNSGWKLNTDFKEFDAENRFHIEEIKPNESSMCISGQILQGIKKPFDCPAFAIQCSPEYPLGAPMVSLEGTCSAYYRYGKFR